MFERRIRVLLAGIAGLYAVFLGRVFFLQTFEVRASRDAVEQGRRRSFLVPPTRGSIRDAAGRLMAWDDLGFHLQVVPRELGAREWECDHCGRVTVTWESDPGPGAAEPLPAARPESCSCGGDPAGIVASSQLDRLALSTLLDEDRVALAAELEEHHAAGWKTALVRAEPVKVRSRRHVLRDWASRPRVMRRRVSRESAMEVYLHPERYRGIQVTAERVRRRTEDMPEALVTALGSTGPALAEDRPRLQASGLSDARIFRLVMGRSGLERSQDERLRGTFGVEEVRRDRYGQVDGENVLEPVRHGEDLRLTLDVDLCRAAEEALEGRSGAVVVMDPRTGAILALAGAPVDGSLPAVQGLVPGSVLKPLTALVGLDMDAVPGPREVFCRGHASRPIRCEHEHGYIDLEEAISGSCNDYFAHLGMKCGVQALRHWGRILGIDRPPVLGLDGEGGGSDWTVQVFRPGTPWNSTDLANLGVGQGPVLLSPVQIASLYSVFANGGRPVQPHLVAGSVPLPGSSVLPPSSLSRIRRGLEGTVLHGTATDAGLERFRVAGKTGTAQLPGRRALNAWFVGYAPSEDPRVVVVAVLTDQEGSGGRVAGPVVTEVLEAWTRGGGMR